MRKGPILKSRGSEAGLPELERILTSAAARRRESKPSHWRRLPGARGSRFVAAGLCAVVFGGTAMAATGVWNPLVGSDDHPATLSDSPVPPGLAADFGILRREQTARDRSPAVEATLDNGPNGFKYIKNLAVRLDSVRYLAPGPNHDATILFSGVTTVRPLIEPEKERWTAELEEICLGRPIRGFEEAAFLCFERSEVMSGHAVMGEAGVVPDGVAAVTVETREGNEVTVPVRDNYWELPSGMRASTFEAPTVWRDEDGKFIPRPDPYETWWLKRIRKEAKTDEPYRPEHT